MKIAWVTDPHLDHVDGDVIVPFLEQIAASGADRLVLSGDIADAVEGPDLLVALAGRLAMPIDFVLGNHDYYRGTIAEVRSRMAALTGSTPNLNWLPATGVVSLTPEVALLGHGGWGDARAGDFAGSSVRLNDYRLIGELAGRDWEALRGKLNDLGDEAAAFVRRTLPTALETHRAALFVTHVPPFRAACVFKGRVSNDDWAPHFTCEAVGEALLEVMAARPDRRLLVLCGHVHSAGTVQVAANLVVITGEAEYGRPEIRRLLSLPDDLDAAFLDPPTA